MNTKELAQQLTGIEYPVRISRELRAEAESAGLVIVYGGSDDLMEFEGAIHDELSCYGGGTAWVDSRGLVPNFEDIDRDDKDAFRDYFKRVNSCCFILALWCAEEGYSWTYRTDISHDTFEVVDEGTPYCRGIVFALADVAFGVMPC